MVFTFRDVQMCLDAAECGLKCYNLGIVAEGTKKCCGNLDRPEFSVFLRVAKPLTCNLTPQCVISQARLKFLLIFQEISCAK